MFNVIRGSHYWDPKIDKSIRVGDLVYFEITSTGVHISLTNNKDSSFIFFGLDDFKNHFEEVSEIRNRKINQLLSNRNN